MERNIPDKEGIVSFVPLLSVTSASLPRPRSNNYHEFGVWPSSSCFTICTCMYYTYIKVH